MQGYFNGTLGLHSLRVTNPITGYSSPLFIESVKLSFSVPVISLVKNETCQLRVCRELGFFQIQRDVKKGETGTRHPDLSAIAQVLTSIQLTPPFKALWSVRNII